MTDAAIPGDATKITRAIIAAAQQDDPPRRLLLGSDAYALVQAALAERLAAVEAQRELALSTETDGHQPTGARPPRTPPMASNTHDASVRAAVSM